MARLDAWARLVFEKVAWGLSTITSKPACTIALFSSHCLAKVVVQCQTHCPKSRVQGYTWTIYLCSTTRAEEYSALLLLTLISATSCRRHYCCSCDRYAESVMFPERYGKLGQYRGTRQGKGVRRNESSSLCCLTGKGFLNEKRRLGMKLRHRNSTRAKAWWVIRMIVRW